MLDGWTNISRNDVYAVLVFQGTEVNSIIKALDLHEVWHTSRSNKCNHNRVNNGDFQVVWVVEIHSSPFSPHGLHTNYPSQIVMKGLVHPDIPYCDFNEVCSTWLKPHCKILSLPQIGFYQPVLSHNKETVQLDLHLQHVRQHIYQLDIRRTKSPMGLLLNAKPVGLLSKNSVSWFLYMQRDFWILFKR